MDRYSIALEKPVPEEWLRLKKEAENITTEFFAQIDARFPVDREKRSKQDCYNYMRRLIQKMKIIRDLRTKGVEPYASLVDQPFLV
jgi:hypothetical protein